jgi:hypothetical protein
VSLRNKEIIRVGVETAYATEQTTLATALVVGDLDYNPAAAAREQRQVSRPHSGNQAYLTGFRHASIGFTTELSAPSALALVTDAPPWAALLQGCAMAQTFTAASKFAYNPILAADKSLSAAVYKASNKHRLVGLRGNARISVAPGRLATMALSYSGRNAGYLTETMPSAAIAEGAPRAVRPEEVTLTLGGTSLCLVSAEVDLGNEVVHTNSTCDEWVINDHRPSVTLTVEMPDFATRNLLTDMEGEVVGALALTWGATGHKVRVSAPKVSFGQISYGRQAVHTMSIPLACLPDAGNDEILIETGALV